MMITDSFLQVFDKIANSVTDNCCNVYEKQAGATMNRVIIVDKGARMVCYDENAVKDMKPFTIHRSSFLRDKECDGIVLVEKNYPETYKIILTDLKSGFDLSNIEKAYKQMFFSFLKLHAMLSLCEGYDVNSHEIEMIAACKCMRDKVQEDNVYKILNDRLKTDAKTARTFFKLINEGTACVKLADFPIENMPPLNKDIYNKEIRLFLSVTQTPNDSIVLHIG